MVETYHVPLTTLVQEHEFEVIYEASDYASIRLTVEDVSRPGIQLAGYFEHTPTVFLFRLIQLSEHSVYRQHQIVAYFCGQFLVAGFGQHIVNHIQ